MWVDGAVVDWPPKEDMAIALLSMSKSGPRLPPLFLFYFLFLRLPFSQFRSMYVRACGILRTACWVRKNKTKLNNLVRTNKYSNSLILCSRKYMTMAWHTYRLQIILWIEKLNCYHTIHSYLILKYHNLLGRHSPRVSCRDVADQGLWKHVFTCPASF